MPAGGGGGSRSSDGGGGGGGGAQLDIIDLDRYMRPLPRRDLARERLEVDGGGGGGGASSGSGSSASARGGRGGAGAARDKRYSHDSGLSDGSYLRGRRAPSAHRPHSKRGETGAGRARREARGDGEAADMRSFRAACERALRDQQEQIARVAALCERLAAPPALRAAPPALRAAPPAPRRARDSSSELSELSSTSRSRSRDTRRRDTHRVVNEYKTYKIIMSKLDDLNRRLAAQTGGRARGAGRSAGSSQRRTPHVQGRTARASSRLVERAVGDADEECAAAAAPAGAGVGVGGPQGARSQLARLSPRRAHELDIPPRPPPPRLNVATESVVQRCSSSSGESTHVFAQTKRIKAPSRRSRSAEAASGERSAPHSPAGSAGGCGARGGLGGLAAGFWRAPSLCHLCRSYWRALRHCIRHQFTPAL